MAIRRKAARPAKAVDPHLIPETVCDGPFNLQVTGSRGTLTFTHLRTKTSVLLASGQVDVEAVVRARIVTSLSNLVALRDLLNQLLPDKSPKLDAALHGAGGEAGVH
jgi:hypothetical protein